MAALLLLVSVVSASAHAGSVAFWRVVIDADDARSEILLSLDDLARMAPSIGSTVGDVPVERLDAARQAVIAHFVVTADGIAVPAEVVSARVLASGLLEVRLQHQIADAAASLGVRSTFHAITDASHRVVTRVERRGGSDAFVLTRETEAHTVPPVERAQSATPGVLAMVRLGIAHILTGYDHLVFLACLLVPGGTWRSRVAIVSAFTVAHSLTLILGAMGLVALPARFVEPAIAVSLAYVAIENLLALGTARSESGPYQTVRSRRTCPTVSDRPGDRLSPTRWPTAFLFGLVHGLGFAGMLDVLDLPLRQWLAAVLAFNVGVEVGQLAVVGVALPLIVFLARSRWHRPVVQSTSVVVLGLAVVWFVERLQ
jgi:hypothetical protein